MSIALLALLKLLNNLWHSGARQGTLTDAAVTQRMSIPSANLDTHRVSALPA